MASSLEELSTPRGSRGPYTAAKTLEFPISKYAEPSADQEKAPKRHRSLRNSSDLRPSNRSPWSDKSSMRISDFLYCYYLFIYFKSLFMYNIL
uniref:Uncharacterized protein n=1 Tax=Lepeophtheirus salmonis TaxID=72036 RepID=A0A0K2THV5_LEPSM